MCTGGSQKRIDGPHSVKYSSGLQWKDINWKKKCIYVERTLSVDYCSGNKVMKYGSVKTVNSYRKIPFMGRLEEILRMQQIKQDQLKK